MAGRRDWSRGASVSLLLAGYAAALGVGWAVAREALAAGPLTAALLGDLAATAVVFALSAAVDNTSVYDPYWSVLPLPLAVWWYCHPGPTGPADPVRFGLAAALLGLWGLRLTANFLRGWGGLGQEDWRYAAYRPLGKVRYRLVSLFALQLTPTLIVFGAMLPVYSLTRSPGRGPGLLDGLAALVAGGALILETAADEQKRRRKAVCAPGEFVAAGLWSRCRHPNYLGEVGFWWGVFFFALGAGWAQSWTAVGAAAMTLLFRLVSVPLMDRRLAGRYPGYAAWARRVPALLPGRRRT